MKMTEEVRAFWQWFLRDTGRAADTPCLDVFHFDLTERWAEELLELVLRGQKRATASSEAGFFSEGLPLPRPGDLSVVVHWDGRPGCVIETRRVPGLRLRAVPFDLARLEGEDDCLESWREKHRRFFQQEGAQLGYAFTPDMTVVFEEFEVVYPI